MTCSEVSKMLSNLRALDLTDENGFLCGKILADLGVDVIKVEKPGGDVSRNMGPFYADIPEPEKSLYWFAYNSNKRGITLDIEIPEGRRIFKDLIKTADFIIESFPAGYMDKLGLGYEALKKTKADIILTSITPFGQSGPYRDYKATDIVAMGMSGILYQTGDIERPPVQMSLPQACLHAGADAAAGTMIAYYHRETTGEGQHVDVSMQQSAAWFLANAIPFWELNHIISKRSGTFRWSMNSSQRQVWECRDGHVFFNIIGGRTGAKTLHELVDWMDSRGMANDYLKSMDWETLDMFKVDQSVVDKISQPIEAFFRAQTKKEISQGAIERHISICPLSSMEDLYNNEQLKSRDFWTDVKHPELKASLPYPGGFLQSSEEKQGIRRRAPLVGEHNDEIFGEIGLSGTKLTNLKRTGII
jgi:crotonobetainyl-CoA:carnitine CoA-transferase CaiB-like acyl-CoA transferase